MPGSGWSCWRRARPSAGARSRSVCAIRWRTRPAGRRSSGGSAELEPEPVHGARRGRRHRGVGTARGSRPHLGRHRDGRGARGGRQAGGARRRRHPRRIRRADARTAGRGARVRRGVPARGHRVAGRDRARPHRRDRRHCRRVVPGAHRSRPAQPVAGAHRRTRHARDPPVPAVGGHHRARCRGQPRSRRGGVQRSLRPAPERGHDRRAARGRPRRRRGQRRSGRARPAAAVVRRSDRGRVDALGARAGEPGAGIRDRALADIAGARDPAAVRRHLEHGAGSPRPGRVRCGAARRVARSPSMRRARRHGWHCATSRSSGSPSPRCDLGAAAAGRRARRARRVQSAYPDGVSTLSDLVLAQGRSDEADVEWLHLLVGDWQLLADLAFADIVLWVPSKDDSFVAVAHARPSSAATLFYRDFVGQSIKPEWKAQVTEAFETAQDRRHRRARLVRGDPDPRARGAGAAAPRTERQGDHRAPDRGDHPAHQPQRGADPQPAGAHLQRVRERPVRDDRLRRLPRSRRPERPAAWRAPGIRRSHPPRRRRGRHVREPERALGVQPDGLRERARGRVARRGDDRAAGRRSRWSTSRCRSWSPDARRGAPTSRRAG